MLCRNAIFLVVIVLLMSACQVRESRPELETKQKIKSEWAQRLELPGVPNLHKVSEDFYRGAQPTAEGMRQLEKLGIKTVINLRFILSDRDKIKGTGLDYEHINTTTLSTETVDVIRFLKVATDAERTPIFVHCHRGVERTGIMCAVYRIVVQGWARDEAIEEMTKGGFTTRTIKKNLLDYIRKVDVTEIKHSAGLND
jgi:protein tyrosine/serine phosphatase